MENLNTNMSASGAIPDEIYIIDAPGINGMGPDAYERFKKHVENGGRVLHKARLLDNCFIEYCEPNGQANI